MRINITIDETLDNLILLAESNGWDKETPLDVFLSTFIEKIIFDKLSDPVIKAMTEQIQKQLETQQEIFANELSEKISVSVDNRAQE